MLYVNYDDVIGEMIVECTDGEGGTYECKETICGCNGLCAAVQFFKQNGTDMVKLGWFFVDKDHMKNCLGLEKGYDNMFEVNGWKRYKKLRLKAGHKASKILLDGFYKAFKGVGDDFVIEIVSDIKED